MASDSVLPPKIDKLLAVISKIYGKTGELELQEIVVNSKVQIVENNSVDGWNGGTFGHSLVLTVSESLFMKIMENRKSLGEKIQKDLNGNHRVENEFIDHVAFEMELPEDQDWRKASGVLQTSQRQVPVRAEQRIWATEGFRLFLSHKHEDKEQAAELKEKLDKFGVTCFVAHEDIHPTKEWQDEIENALHTMDGFAAIMTEGFHDSVWTDQEVGFAFGRGVPIVAVRMGKDPYGFIGKFQALNATWKELPKKLLAVFIENPKMLDAFIGAIERCGNWDCGNDLSSVFPKIERLTDQQIDRITNAYRDNDELRGSFGFKGNRSSFFGQGLAFHLKRISGRNYEFDADYNLVLRP
jgi:TIR domain